MSRNPQRRVDPPPEQAKGAARERFPIFIGIAIAALFLYFIRAILMPFLLAGIVGFLAAPLLAWLARRTRLPRALFAAGLFVLILGVVAVVGAFVGPSAVRAGQAVIADAQSTIESTARQLIGDRPVHVLGTTVDAAGIAQTVITAIQEALGNTSTLARLGEWSFAAIFGFFLTIVLLFYFLAGGPRIARGLLWLVPPLHRDTAQRISARLDPVLRRYFLGVLVVVVYATIAAYLGLGLILGIKHAVLLACMTGLLEMMPVIGPVTSAVIAGLVAIRYATGIGSIIGYAIYATALRLSIDELIGPVVLGRAAHVHPVLVIFCFLSGGILFGIVGVIMAMPVALALKEVLAELYDEPA